MKKHRLERNVRIKKGVMKQLDLGLSLKEALVVVAERWYLSPKQVERIYYETYLDNSA